MSELLNVSGGQIAYQKHGSGGQVLVALPGIGDTRASYRRLAPMLAEAGHTVYVMDLRGHGGSTTAFGGHTSEDIGDDVVALLESLDLREVTLIGNSVGAAASVHASLRSDRVARFVSLSGFVSDPPKFRLIRPMLRLMFARLWGVGAWARYRKTLFITPPADMSATEAALLENLREPGRLQALRSMMLASKAGIAARLGEVSVPALIAMGAQDPDFPDQVVEAQRQARLLGGTNTVAVIEGAGHYPQIEKPNETLHAILAFMEATQLGA